MISFGVTPSSAVTTNSQFRYKYLRTQGAYGGIGVSWGYYYIHRCKTGQIRRDTQYKVGYYQRLQLHQRPLRYTDIVSDGGASLMSWCTHGH